MKINLYQNYYIDKSIARQKEIDFCFKKNLSNNFINLIIIESQNRLLFNDFFKKINQISGKDDVNIIANSDIYFDDTVEMYKCIKEDQSFCLSRWDILADGSSKLFDRQDSQDTFCFLGKPRNIDGNFPMGFRGCDNKLTYELQKSGYQVFNPSKTLRSYHVHNTGIRNYNQSNEFLVPPPYLMCKPILLSEII